jgi:hypothetical protein
VISFEELCCALHFVNRNVDHGDSAEWDRGYGAFSGDRFFWGKWVLWVAAGVESAVDVVNYVLFEVQVEVGGKVEVETRVGRSDTVLNGLAHALDLSSMVLWRFDMAVDSDCIELGDDGNVDTLWVTMD